VCLMLEVYMPRASADAVRSAVVRGDHTRTLAAAPVAYSSIWLREREWHLSLSREAFYGAGETVSCACGLHTWRGETPTEWHFPRWARGRLRRSLRALLEQAPDGIVFIAAWAGDPPTEEQAVTWAEMSEIIWTGRIGKRIAYRIGGVSQPPDWWREDRQE
jgi:hypothetical protein